MRGIYDPERDIAQLWLCTAGRYTSEYASNTGGLARFPIFLAEHQGSSLRRSDVYDQASREKRHSGYSKRMEDPAEIFTAMIDFIPKWHLYESFLEAKPVVVVCKQDAREIAQSSVRLMMHYSRIYQSIICGLERNGWGDGEDGVHDRGNWTLIRRLEGLINEQMGHWRRVVLV